MQLVEAVFSLSLLQLFNSEIIKKDNLPDIFSTK